MSEKIIKRHTVYNGKYLILDIVNVKQPNDQIADREVVTVPDAVGILPIGWDGKIHLVKQFRPAIDKYTIEVPAGLIDDEETPEEAARRELREELGLKGPLKRVNSFYHAEGYSSGKTHLFVCENAILTSKPKLDSTEFIEKYIVTYTELGNMINSGEIQDPKTIILFLSYRIHNLRNHQKLEEDSDV